VFSNLTTHFVFPSAPLSAAAVTSLLIWGSQTEPQLFAPSTTHTHTHTHTHTNTHTIQNVHMFCFHPPPSRLFTRTPRTFFPSRSLSQSHDERFHPRTLLLLSVLVSSALPPPRLNTLLSFVLSHFIRMPRGNRARFIFSFLFFPSFLTLPAAPSSPPGPVKSYRGVFSVLPHPYGVSLARGQTAECDPSAS